MIGLQDRLSRRVRYLRVSVTDRCNLRCRYCLPERVTFKPKEELLTFDEIERVVRLFVEKGVSHVRLTGGEPLVRRDLPELVRRIAAIPGVADLAMTTNATRLAEHAVALREAGLRRLNVSIDTVDPVRFHEITRGGQLSEVLAGLHAARAAGFERIKLNAVMVRGTNDDQVPSLLRFAAEHDAILRLIEYMPIGIDSFWQDTRFVPIDSVRDGLVAAGYRVEPAPGAEVPVGGGPAQYWRVTPPEGPSQTVGFVAALTHNFCAACNRVRLTSDGRVRECLSDGGRSSLRDAMRGGADDQQLSEMIHTSLYGKVDGHGFRADSRTGGRASFVPMSALGG